MAAAIRAGSRPGRRRGRRRRGRRRTRRRRARPCRRAARGWSRRGGCDEQDDADGLGGPDDQRGIGLGAVDEAGQRVGEAGGEGDDVADGVEGEQEDECGAGSGHGDKLAAREGSRHRPAEGSGSALRLISAALRTGYRPAHAPTSPRRRPDRRRARGAVARPGAGRADRPARRRRADRARHHRPDRVAAHLSRRGGARRDCALVPPHRRLHRPRLRRGLPALLLARRPRPGRPPRLAVCAFALVTGAIGTTQSHPVLYEYVTTFFIVVGPTVVGRLARRQREQAERLRDLTAHLERERERTAHLAVDEERARIARELHDVVAHGLSVIAIQSDAAEAALDSDPELARAPLRAIRASAARGAGRHAAAARRPARGRGRRRARAAARARPARRAGRARPGAAG